MARSFPALGFDPTPGDVDETRTLAKQLSNIATDLTTTYNEISRVDCTAWHGKAATAFSNHVSHDVQPLIGKAKDSFSGAADALADWAVRLAAFQHRADDLERRAAAKQQDVTSTGNALNALKGDSSGGDHPDPAAKKKQDDLKDSHKSAQHALDSLRQEAEDLHGEYRREAVRIGHRLQKAGHIAPEKPGLLHSIAHGVEEAWDATKDWVKEHADLIKVISDFVSDLSGVLGMLAIITAPFEPLGAIFAGAAVATSAIALVGHLVAKAGGANVGWMSIGFDALGAIPGIGVFSKGVKVVDGAVAAGRAGELGNGFRGVTTIGRNIVGLGGDAVSAAKEFKLPSLGMRFLEGKSIALGGLKAGGVIKAEGFMNRLQLVSEAGYQYGQRLGVGGLKFVTGGRVNIDAMSGLGRGIDATVKIAPKLLSIPEHIGEAMHLYRGSHQPAAA
ncbi:MULTISPECIES: putative T7SS-secreted protein [Streptomycetaceae]|uniref:Integral membrane protein n=1 Tax=Streptantibioticus cattleyicolor (strain ATCC 35852 / DSM 46488 / JCM 4925 / NBRC 14057 / NRRL 8057) TaxID=1003195 RepID=F8K1K5_STREN|nr:MULTISPECIES: hypothetical protein [Streptomycetaceae]AEW94922.1 integral membrane protein [Streptantibioticus cattleyicolor NRRL 8057 = DSM 46488]MYS59528.1 hypothetical protein [Streptomyces sp. SID5468]CCB75272.1 protein of unknown function [Streptantibioticus cattleyicolor NRRL 8057 = DSM 46488]